MRTFTSFGYRTETLEDGIEIEFIDFPTFIGLYESGTTDMTLEEYAEDLLIAGLRGEMKMRQPLPTPHDWSGPVIRLSYRTQLKLALYDALRRRNLANVKLAELIRGDEKQVRRMLDLDTKTKTEVASLENALRALGVAFRSELIVYDDDLRAGGPKKPAGTYHANSPNRLLAHA